MQKKLLLLIGVSLILNLTVFGQNKIDERQQANIYFKQKNYTAATEAYTNIIKNQTLADTAMARVYFFRAECYKYLNKFKKSYQDYTASIKLWPDDYNSYWDRGVLNETENDYQEAINDYRNAFSRTPVKDTIKRSALYSNIANVQYKQRLPDSSLKNDSIALSIFKYNSSAFAIQAMVHAYQKNYSQAITDCISAIRYDRDRNNIKHFATLYVGLGDLRRLNKQYKEAINAYSFAIKIDPDNKIAYWNRGAVYHYHKDYELATDDYAKAITYYKDNKKDLSMLYNDKAMNELGDGLLTQAIQDDSIAIVVDPLNKAAYPIMATAYLQNGDYQKCIDITKTIIRFELFHTKFASPYFSQIAASEYFLKKYDKVISSSSKAISLDPNNGSAYFYRAKAYLKNPDQKDLAAQDIEKVILLDTSKISYSYTFSLYYKGKSDEAISMLQKDIVSNNDIMGLSHDYYNLACLYSLMNKPNEANNYLKMAVDKGYSKKYATDDEDLNNIRNTADYKAIMGDGK